MLQFGHIVNEVTANKAITKFVKTMLARFEPLNRVSDPFFQDEVVSRWGKAIL